MWCDSAAEMLVFAASEGLNPITFRGVNFRGDLAIWTAVVFLVVLAILWKYAWKPLSAALDRREQGLADQLAQAQAANEQARRLLEEYQQKLAAAEAQVQEIIEAGRKEAERVGRELIADAKAETAREREQALKRIDAAADAALQELADRSAALAIELAGKILQSELSPEKHARLLETTLAAWQPKRSSSTHHT